MNEHTINAARFQWRPFNVL